ncbi:MAG: alpha/beta hydrolase fold domain-containing protein [Candidatus Hydrogenedentes bacterium]|nr:alpha/beta hydrolase fold domain-containing protein [Candidatus Hydrogenedentota bacterium]
MTLMGVAAAADREAPPAPDRCVVYKTVDGITLQLHVFEPSAAAANAPRPAIVFFFGGGWQNGSPKQFYPHCRHFAERGMVAMAAEYRIKNTHGTTPVECVKDGKSAVRWIRAHARELGVDPERIAAGGGSAGGHVAACTGIIAGFEEAGEDTAVSSVPDALVLFNPVYDTVNLERLAERFGAHVEALSPSHHVAPGAPPAIAFHGTGDATVPFAQAERFRDLMTGAGNTCKLIGFEGKPHGFFNYHKDPEACAETLRAADAFLVEQGFLGPREDAQ